MAKFETREDKLYIDDKLVLRGWESYSGWYWFAIREVQKQDTDLGNGRVAVNDTIYYGFVQGHVEEWGDFSLAELESDPYKVWEIPQENLTWSGRRS